MPYILTYVAIILSTVIATLRKPPVALALVFCMFGMEQWAQSVHPFFTQYHTLTNILVGAVLVFALCVDMFKRGGTLHSYPTVGWFAIALYVYALVSTLWAPTQANSLDVWSKTWPYIITVVGLTPLLIKRPEDLHAALNAVLPLGAALVVLLLYTSRWEDHHIVLQANQGFAYGNPLAVGTMGGYVAIIAILQNFKGRSYVWQLLRWVVVAVSLVMVIQTSSRGPFIFMVLVTILFIPLSRSIRNMRMFLAVVITILMVLFIVDHVYDAYRDLEDVRWGYEKIEADIMGRVNSAIILLDKWFSSPATILFGLGNSASYDPRIVGIYVHIVPLEILAEEGLIGAVLYLSILFSTLCSFRRSFRMVRYDPMAKGALATIGALFTYELLLTLKQGSLLGMPYMYAFAIIIGKLERQLAAAQVDSYGQNRMLKNDQQQCN